MRHCSAMLELLRQRCLAPVLALGVCRSVWLRHCMIIARLATTSGPTCYELRTYVARGTGGSGQMTRECPLVLCARLFEKYNMEIKITVLYIFR